MLLPHLLFFNMPHSQELKFGNAPGTQQLFWASVPGAQSVNFVNMAPTFWWTFLRFWILIFIRISLVHCVMTICGIYWIYCSLFSPRNISRAPAGPNVVSEPK